MTESMFKGIRFGGGTLIGLLDDAPRIIIPRAGVEIVTEDGSGTKTILTDVIADTAQIAFDSDWVGTATILARGVATPSQTNKMIIGGWTFGVLATWSDPGYVPVPMIFDHGAGFGPTSDAQWGFSSLGTAIDGTDAVQNNVLHTAVDRTRLAVTQGNLYNGTTIPARSLQYVVLGISAL